MRNRDLRQLRRAAHERDHADPYSLEDDEPDEPHDGWAPIRERNTNDTREQQCQHFSD